MVSLLCGLNMLIILEINGSDIWHGLSWLVVAVLVLGLAELKIGSRLFSGLKFIAQSTTKIPLLALWFFIIATGGMTAYFNERYQIHQIQLNANQQFLTDLTLVYAKQDHGTMALHRSFDGNHLSLANRRHAQGIGTHASSDIQYQLPEGASEFSFSVGLDDEVGTADVQFSVWGDDKLLWESEPYLGHERDLSTHNIDVRGVQKLNLKVAPLKDDKWDHADWVNTVITIATEPATQDEALPAATSNSTD
uniref:Glycosyl hydrolase family 98 n=1 Tax=uncultured organism TaxID=155900 RepID=D8VN10_9ZZZZ|nr:glycosyl hydrolase family 98 [uncultured organism]